MAKQELTQAFVNNPPAGAKEYSDTMARGLRFRTGAKGGKVFEHVTRVDGKLARIPLGSATDLTLDEARKILKQKSGAGAGKTPIVTVADLWAEYKKVKGNQASFSSKEGLWKRYVLPIWADKVCNHLTKAMAFELLNAVEERATTNQKFMVLRNVNPVFQWAAAQKNWIAHNPFSDIALTRKKNPRKRFLNLRERRALMEWAEGAAYPVGPMVKVAALTGVRLGEVISMRRSDFEGHVWHVKRTDSRKHGVTQSIPLTPTLIDLLKDLPKLHPDYVFAHSGRGTKAGHMAWGDDQMNAVRDVLQFDEHWSFHSLRHTYPTVAREHGADKFKIKVAMGHKENSVTEDYTHAEYLADIYEVLETVEMGYTRASEDDKWTTQDAIWD